MKALWFASLILITACKGEEVAALVNCEVTAGPALECSIKQTKGRSEIDVCWDFSVTCANQATLEANHICQKLRDGAARNITVAADKLKITGRCEGEMKAAVTNMTINGDPAQRN